MPVQGPQWSEFLSCPVCLNVFDEKVHRPISLGCGHTVCKTCLGKLHQNKCPFDQSAITHNIDKLPANYALLQLVGAARPDKEAQNSLIECLVDSTKYYSLAVACIEELAQLLKPISSDATHGKSETSTEEGISQKQNLQSSVAACDLTRPMQRKLVTLINCQLIEEEGRARAMRAARSLGERTVTELILQHQNPQQLSGNLWAAVRSRGCQFLGPAMQEEVLRLILLALEDGSELSRKVLVLFVVQRLEPDYPQASKTAIGHVVQLLYRASCFKVTKRKEESSLMQLKEEFRSYDSLRREHDSQIVQIAMEAGLRISPEQWSSLLYGDAVHKSHMQSIIDKLQTPQSFGQSVSELVIALQRTGDPCNLQRLRPHLDFLASIDPSPDVPSPSWENLEAILKALKTVVFGLVDFLHSFNQKKHELLPLQNARYKTSMCRDLTQKGNCPRCGSCTFAHTQEELEKYRARSKKFGGKLIPSGSTFGSLTPREKAELAAVNKITNEKLTSHSVRGAFMNKADDLFDDADSDTNSITSSLASLSVLPGPVSKTASITTVTSASLGNTFPPTMAAPAQYRQPGIDNRSAVKEIYYHSSPAPGIASIPKMTPYETPTPVRGPYYPRPPAYEQPITRGPVPSQYPPLSYQPQESVLHGMQYHNPGYVVYDQQSVTLRPSPESWVQQPQYYPRHEDPYGRGTVPVGPTGYTWDPGIYQPGTVPAPAPAAAPAASPFPNQCSLDNLHLRRKEIIAKLHHNATLTPRGPARDSSSSTLVHAVEDIKTALSRMPYVGDQKQISSSALAKSVSDTYVIAQTALSLASSGLANENKTASTYMPWSCEEGTDILTTSSPIMAKPTMNKHDDAEEEREDTDSWFDHFKNLAEDAVQREDDFCIPPEQWHDSFIPFDPPIVSRFGPISRTPRAKFSAMDPVQVTAKKEMKMFTAVTPTERPYPITSPVSSTLTRTDHLPLCPTLSAEHACLLNQTHSNPLVHKPSPLPTPLMMRDHLHQELVRLEHNSQDAVSEDERLAYELQAVELKISLQTGKKAEPSRAVVRNLALDGSLQDGLVQKSAGINPGLELAQEKKIDLLSCLTSEERKRFKELHVALKAQEHLNKSLNYKKEQEQLDRQYAEQLMIEELEAGP